MSKSVAEMTNDEIEVWTKQMNMANILASVFGNFRNYGLNPGLRKLIEEDPTYIWSGQNGRKITRQDLAEFMLQVAGCVFSPKNEKVDDEQGSR